MSLAAEEASQELVYEQFDLPSETMHFNCDGYHNGCLLEFKKSNRITVNAAMFQAIKYLRVFT